jgi:hypothetical protein
MHWYGPDPQDREVTLVTDRVDSGILRRRGPPAATQDLHHRPGRPPGSMTPLASLRATARTVARHYGGRDRLSEYGRLIRTATGAGYEAVTLGRFHEDAAAGPWPVGRRLVLRHDVDIRDPVGNEAFYAAELAAGARSTFYFRLSTVEAHRPLIGRLLRDGFEVGYHFEEAATVARQYGLGSRAAVEERRDQIHDLFRRNCELFRASWNPGLVSVASHGDWINRRLGFVNHEFVSRELLQECGLAFEAYSTEILDRVDVYVSDVASPPAYWSGGYGLADALRDGRDPICMLTHERRWHVDRRASLSADTARTIEGVRYRWHRRRPGRTPNR